MSESTEQDRDEPIGTGWRIAAWLSFAVAALLAGLAMTTRSQDFIHAFTLAAGLLLAMLFTVTGILFAIFGAVAAAAAGHRRPAIIFPVLANAALLLFVVGTVFAV